MKQAKYIGMDVHQATTVVMVLNADGKLVWEKIVETQAGPIIDLLESLSGELHVTFEETTQAEWLYNVVRGYVSEVIVCDPRRNKLLSDGSKTDRGGCPETGRAAPGRMAAVGLPRARCDADVERTGPRI